jgi:TonB family protein
MNALLLALAPILSAPEALPPHGPWQVAYEESMCLAARQFGAKGEVTLAFRPGPLSDYMELSIDVPRWPGRLMFRGKADLQIARGDQRFEASYEAMGDAGRAIRAIVVVTRSEVLDRLTDDDVLTVAPQPNGRLAFRLTNLVKLKSALADCRRTLLRHWGIDVAAVEQVDVPAKPIDGDVQLITTSDYPAEAARKGVRGTSNIVWTIGESGGVSDCRTVGSSGSEELDRAACAAIMRRARYEPARDAKGNAVKSWQSRRIRWRAFGR